MQADRVKLPRLPTWAPWAAAGALVGAVLLRAWKPPNGSPGGGLWGPADPFNGAPVDAYASLESEEACDPTPKPGVLLFRQWVIDTWGQNPGTAAHPTPQNIIRDCAVGGASGHHQGKAWDLMTNSIEHGQAVIDALLAPDPVTGEAHALARRAGLRYIIWYRQMWRAYPYAGNPSGTWVPYEKGEAASPHVDHAHFSFSEDGAAGLTSLYDALRAGALVA